MDLTLKKVHEIQLEMALEVKRICEKHNIKYSIIAGTLLGAIRHNGFIPWDDDLDIGMLRSEYEKFIEVCKYELKDDYFLQTWEFDSGFPLPIAKIRKNGTRFVEKNSSEASSHNGIFIDIFPFDNIPQRRIEQIFQNCSTYILMRMLLVRMNYKVWKDNEFTKKMLYRALKILSLPLSIEKIKSILHKLMIAYNEQPLQKVVNIGGAYGYNKETIKKEWLEELKEINFEGENLLAPVDSEGYLTYFYGDYMTPPPENARYNRHNIIEVYVEEDK